MNIGVQTNSPNTHKPIAIAVVERSSEAAASRASKKHFDEVLIGVRPDGVPLAGYWEFPGGKVQPNESFESAAVRECLEETGLEVVVVGEYPDVTFDYEHGSVHLRFFRCRLHADEVQREPQPPFCWTRKSQLDRLRFPEANATLIQLLLKEASA